MRFDVRSISELPRTTVSRLHRFVACGLAIAMIGLPAAASAESFVDDAIRGAEITYDVVVLRPLNVVATALGAAFFVVSLPLVAPFEGISESWDVFVYQPYEYAFRRPLGDL